MSKMNSFQNKVINFLIITFCSVVGLTTIRICSNVNIYKVSESSIFKTYKKRQKLVNQKNDNYNTEDELQESFDFLTDCMARANN